MAFGTDASARAAYFRDSVSSASPAQQLAMLYDRLLLDLRWAEKCQDENDWIGRQHAPHSCAGHPRPNWPERSSPNCGRGGPALMSLYVYLAQHPAHRQFPPRHRPTREAIELLEPLRSPGTWPARRASAESIPVRIVRRWLRNAIPGTNCSTNWTASWCGRIAEFGLGNEVSGIWSMDEIRASFGGTRGELPESLVPRARQNLDGYNDAFVRINAAKRLDGRPPRHAERPSSGQQPQSTPVYFDRVA